LLKTELNFQGFIVSDWGGQNDQFPSAEAGLDMAMPNIQYWENRTLASAVANRTLSRERLVDMATRIVATWYQFGQDSPSFPEAGVGLAPDLNSPREYIDARPSFKVISVAASNRGALPGQKYQRSSTSAEASCCVAVWLRRYRTANIR
jgi:beta-glucosidase-like glycosyl hydrolase